MSEYTTESPASVAARQRRRRALITLGVVVLGLFFAFWYGLSYYRAASEPEAAAPTPTCSPYDPDAIAPSAITVDVFNATNRNGLAGRTATTVEKRGFKVGKIANDPSDRATPKVAELRYSKSGRPKALVLLEQMPEGTKGHVVDRDNDVVTLVIGTKFKDLRPVAEESGPPMCPAPSESPSATSS